MDSKNVVVQSEYIRGRSCEIYEKTDFFRDSRFQIIPSGVNFEKFNRLLKDKELKKIIEDKVRFSNGPSKKKYDESYDKIKKIEDIEEIKKIIDKTEEIIEYTDIDRDLMSKISEELRGKDNILYIGKLIISKGVHILLMSLPYVFQKNPTTNITIVGYGKFRPALEILLRGLVEGNKELLEIMIEKGCYLEGKKHGELKYLSKFWNSLKKDDKLENYLELAKKIDLDRVVFLGKLDHDILPHVIKKHNVIVVPSIFPESFGMVSIEGMSQGLIPIVFNHSGLKEVIPFEDSLVDLDGEVVNNLEKVINLNLEKLEKIPNINKKFIIESKKYSFESVARKLLDLR